MKTDFRFTLEHVTDGEVEFTLPIQVIYLHDSVVQIMIEKEIEQILDVLWGRCRFLPPTLPYSRSLPQIIIFPNLIRKLRQEAR